jgi:hypothetical protein
MNAGRRQPIARRYGSSSVRATSGCCNSPTTHITCAAPHTRPAQAPWRYLHLSGEHLGVRIEEIGFPQQYTYEKRIDRQT